MYRRFEDQPDEEFDFFLAQKLGMTVWELRHSVDGHEYLGWATYYRRKAQNEELAARQGKR